MITSSSAGRLWVIGWLLALVPLGAAAAAQEEPASVSAAPYGNAPSPLLAIDRNRATVVERIVAQWGDALARADAGISAEQLRDMLLAMRGDHLLAAGLAGSLEGLRNIVASALVSESDVRPSLLHAKALGDADKDLVYVPVTPCRLVETRGTFPAVFQGGGPFAPNQVRTYTVQGGNGVCLTQLPVSVTPSAVQMQVYGIPTAGGSGDVEVLPQGAAFGSSASFVFLGSNAFTSSAVTSLVNLANKQISVQVRSSSAHVVIDVVGYFRAPAGGYVSNVVAGAGLTGGGSGSPVLAVDTTTIQARVSGSCPTGSAIRSIASNGSITCDAGAVQQLYAVVRTNGTLDQGFRVVSTAKLTTGQYEVQFDRNVTTCAYVATPSTFQSEILVQPRSANANAVFVATYNSAGSPVDQSFHLLVNC